MKKPVETILFIAILLCSLGSQAQVSVNINVQAQPLWGPVGYDYVQYYYIPQYDLYYDVPARRYVYLDGGKWLFAAALPPRFAHVDFYSTYKVVVNEPKAYLHYHDHKVKYVKYKSGGGNQIVIKNSNEPKYYVVKGHPHYAPPGQMKKASQGNPRSEGHKSHGPAPSHGGKEKGHGGGKGGGGKGKGH